MEIPYLPKHKSKVLEIKLWGEGGGGFHTLNTHKIQVIGQCVGDLEMEYALAQYVTMTTNTIRGVSGIL